MRSGCSESGAITAELMLAIPSLMVIVGIASTGFSLAFDRVALEREAAVALRELSIGITPAHPPDTELKTWDEGRLVCLELSKPGLIPISASHCTLALA